MLHIRDVRSNDLQICSAIEMECYPPAEAASSENVNKRIEMFPEGFLVLELESQVIGFVNSGATNKDDISDEAFKALIGHEPTGKNMVIFSVAIQPSFQGNGYSKLLLDSFIDRARQLDKSRILLLCKKNLVSFYERFAFQNCGQSSSRHGGARWTEMRLVLK